MTRMRPALALLAACAVSLAVPATAQLLPGVGVPLLPAVGPVEQTLQQTLDRSVETVRQTTTQLLQARSERIAGVLRERRKYVEADLNGQPAVRGELLLVDPDQATLAAARAAGFAEVGAERLGSLDMSIARLQLPRSMSLAEGQNALLRVAPAAEIAPDNLHFQSGRTVAREAVASAAAAK